jgi:3-isopropylmalate/(R)-2-methylmalate dehydratase small subunit
MTGAPFPLIESHAVLLLVDDIDTDQIIPARFLTSTERTGFGEHLFADWRYSSGGMPLADFVLNSERAGTAKILVTGRNFGCGSSREHAPWALRDFGFRAVVATSFADIFRANALKNGLLPVTLRDQEHASLVASLRTHPDTTLRVDLDSCTLSMSNGPSWAFDVPPFARRCLLDGVDQLGFLLAASDEIRGFERHHPARMSTI